jgi:hypothetical protein
MKSLLSALFAAIVLVGVAVAAEPPEAPSAVMAMHAAIASPVVSVPVTAKNSFENKPVVDKTFIGLALISTGATFADSYTTLFARENWLAGKQNVCNMEVQSAYLYGTHPTVGRTYAVAAVKSVSTVAAAYYLRKHHSKFWSLPLIANGGMSLEGVTQNMRACN